MSLPSFGARNPVPANLLMMVLIIGGIWSGLGMRREFFPEIDPEAARVELVYPGASALEIEESLARKVEDAIGNVSEVRRIETTVSEGSGVVVVKFDEGTDVGEGVEDVERAIERLTDLPADAIASSFDTTSSVCAASTLSFAICSIMTSTSFDVCIKTGCISSICFLSSATSTSVERSLSRPMTKRRFAVET